MTEARKGPKSGGGSRKGKPNKVTADVRAAIAEIVQGGISDFQKWLKDIKDPKERCDIFLKLMAFNVPKLAQTEAMVTVRHSIEDFSDDELFAIVRTHAAAVTASSGSTRPN